jgi:serpin B
VIVAATGMPEAPVEVSLDHPFLFFIRDIQTGAILFVGRVVDPGV